MEQRGLRADVPSQEVLELIQKQAVQLPVFAANPSIPATSIVLIMTDETSVACVQMHHAAILLVCHCENHALVPHGFDLRFLPTFLNLLNT